MNKYRVDNFMCLGAHTLVVQRQVSINHVFDGLYAVETYHISPHAPETYHDVNALLDDRNTEVGELIIETRDFDQARKNFCATVIRCANEEIASI